MKGYYSSSRRAAMYSEVRVSGFCRRGFKPFSLCAPAPPAGKKSLCIEKEITVITIILDSLVSVCVQQSQL